ncbi:MAG: CPBP family intramembrane metalloprotease [Deltaproteobacteria bacterium]|nr:CPBP family intramembrane metalloprotease [Deltaproteobacteria bacterium]
MSGKNTIAKVPDTASILLRSVLGWAVAVLLGVAAAFSARFFGFPNLLAAQSTMGVIGLAGGLSHSLLIRAAGGKGSWRQWLFLSLVWTFSCIWSVTPLFFQLGTLSKMALLAFYSFAFFGAIGGVATAFVMRSVFVNAPSRDVIPCILIWSFSFGLAAIASDAVGEVLQTFLPALIAWSIAFVSMVLIIGVGGGYSIVHFLRAPGDRRQTFEKPGIDYKTSSKEKNMRYILVLILLLAPFYLNDFSNIYITDWRLWISIDYTTVKLFPFLVLFWLLRNKKMKPSEFGLTTQPLISFVAVFLIGSLVGTFIDQNGHLIINKLPGYPSIGGMPEIESPLWNWIDLTVGLLMVGIFEELVFRGYLHTFLTRYTQCPLVIIGISALAFGFIHWSGGFHMVMLTSVIGAVFMILYLRTHSLPAIMLAHFVVNFIDFADVIPKSIFRFF